MIFILSSYGLHGDKMNSKIAYSFIGVLLLVSVFTIMSEPVVAEEMVSTYNGDITEAEYLTTTTQKVCTYEGTLDEAEYLQKVQAGYYKRHSDVVFTLEKGNVIPPSVCMDRYLDNTVISFLSTTCPFCQQAVSILQQIEQENNYDDFEYIYLDTQGGQIIYNNLKLQIPYVPITLIDCQAYGLMTKQQYEGVING